MNDLASLYDYDLPPELIAQQPAADRAGSRMLTLRRDTGAVEHTRFSRILDYARPGDVWVFNNTRVFPARLHVCKETGARAELLFQEEIDPGTHGAPVWTALARPGRRLHPGMILYLPGSGDRVQGTGNRSQGSGVRGQQKNFSVQSFPRNPRPETRAPVFSIRNPKSEIRNPVCCVIEKLPDGAIIVELLIRESLFEFLERHGVVPLPPYIRETLCDPSRYNTLYATETGSSAAPTAGLHFTRELLDGLARVADIRRVTLHIGMGTFKPIATERISAHAMHREMVWVPENAAAAVCRARTEGRRVVAVGTTTVRALETWAQDAYRRYGQLTPAPFAGPTELFIHGDYTFRAIDALVTNFHLPRSSLLVMVSALAGRERVLAAYREAARERYRFFSFGDAMFIY